MKNKIKIMLFLMLFMLPFNVKAENEVEANMVLNCDKTKLSPEETTTCTLKINVTKGVIFDINTKISFSDNLSLDGKIVIDSEMDGDGENNHITVQPSDALGHSGLINIASFKVKANSVINGSDERILIESTEITYEQDDGLTKGLANVTKNIRITSNDNNLSNLALSSGTLSPSFSSGTTNYFATVDAPKVTISATKTDSKSTISGSTGEVSLNYEENTFRIIVTSESGSTKTYTITITRPDNRDKNNSLSSLSLNGEVIKLKSDVSEYSYEVENDVTQMRLEAVLDSAKATFDKNYGPRTVDLKEGENLIEIKIIAENEKTRTYTLNIKRKAPVIEEDPGTGDNPGDSGGNSGNETIPDSPPTGSLALYIVLAIVVISIAGLVYYFNQYQKKQVNNSNEKK